MILRCIPAVIVLTLFALSSAHRRMSDKQKGEVRFDQYLRYQDIQDYLNRLNVTYNKTVQVKNYGLSNENRNLTAIKISTGGGRKKPIIFIDGGMHAREWISPAQALYIINQLVENPNVTALVKNVDWLIVPLVNPDGYEFTHTIDRFWRKNRAKGRLCRGVDLNRNFDFQWAQAGASDSECASTYAGPHAFSEPESTALSKLISDYAPRIKLYVSFHAAAQSILYPWGYTESVPSNGRELHQLAAELSDAVYKQSGTEYKVGTFANLLYLGSGTSCDWTYSVTNVKLAYTIELRPSNITNLSRFEIPPKNILTVVSEMFQGIKALHFHIERRNAPYDFFLNKMLGYLSNVTSKHKSMAKMEDFGTSHENRRLVLLRIGTNKRYKPIIFVEAGIHGREWLAPAQALYIIHQLLEVPDNTELLQEVDWIIVPLVNPDGYEYSHRVDRMWRKNRAKGRTCDGVDLNRNFDFQWSKPGASTYECASTYAGKTAFSEPESLALSQVIKKYASRTKLYLSLHTAEQSILFPWGYTINNPKNDNELRRLAFYVSKKMLSISKIEYRVGTSAQILHIISGSSRDWAYGVINISLAYTIELEAYQHPRHVERFIMPPNKISKVVSEMFEGIKVFYRFVRNKYNF